MDVCSMRHCFTIPQLHTGISKIPAHIEKKSIDKGNCSELLVTCRLKRDVAVNARETRETWRHVTSTYRWGSRPGHVGRRVVAVSSRGMVAVGVTMAMSRVAVVGRCSMVGLAVQQVIHSDMS